MATNGKFAMAMPSAERKKRAMHQPKQGHWRVNTKDGGRMGNTPPSQSLDDVKTLTPAWCGRRKESAIGAPRDGAPILPD